MLEVGKIKSKTCSSCGKEKQLDDFHKNHVNPDGYAYRCKKCVRTYQKKHFSDPVIHDRKIQSKRKWDEENRVEKRRKDLEQKHKKQFDGRALGTSNICGHISKKYNGEFDFEREMKIIRRERSLVLSKGNKWFTLGATGSIHLSDVRYCVRRHCDVENDEIRLLSSDTRLLLVPYICPICKNGMIIQPIIPYSYEYTDDGVPIQFCSNCGFAVNW